MAVDKLTIIFPPGDQLTSVLISKEKDTKLEELLQRLCTNRAIDLKPLKILNEDGKKIDTSQTVGDSGLVFIEILDKKLSKLAAKEKALEKRTFRPRPDTYVHKVGTVCDAPLKDQLYPDEWQSLQDMKAKYEICQKFSDEYVMSCLFVRKFDFPRTHALLQQNYKWRKENGFLVVPTFEEVLGFLSQLKTIYTIPGSRDKEGHALVYMQIDPDLMVPNKEPWTIANIKKWIVWNWYVGVFAEGMDYFRAGVRMVQDLEGYGWKQFDIDFQKQMTVMTQDIFPQKIAMSSVLNPPKIFTPIIKICKTFMKAKILDRMEVVSKKDLLKSIDADILPEHFGGNAACPYEMRIKLLKEFCAKHEARLTAAGKE